MREEEGDGEREGIRVFSGSDEFMIVSSKRIVDHYTGIGRAKPPTVMLDPTKLRYHTSILPC